MITRASKSGLALCLAFASTGFFSAETQTPERAQRGPPEWQQPRTEWGHPDIQGNWTNATLTTFERQRGLGPVYTQAQVDEIEGRQRSQNETGSDPSDPDRPPPPVTGEIGRSYNQIYYDRGDRVARVDGEPLTSPHHLSAKRPDSGAYAGRPRGGSGSTMSSVPGSASSTIPNSGRSLSAASSSTALAPPA